MKTTDDQEELFDLVNENDEVIGEVRRAVANSDPSMFHRAVVIYVFNKKGELFLQKRSQTKDIEPGIWSVSASGHVARGDTYEQTAMRELEEELGIRTTMKFIKKCVILSERETEINSVYQAIHEGPFVLPPDEVETGAFFSLKKIEERYAQNLLPLSLWTMVHLHTTWDLFPHKKELKKRIAKVF